MSSRQLQAKSQANTIEPKLNYLVRMLSKMMNFRTVSMKWSSLSKSTRMPKMSNRRPQRWKMTPVAKTARVKMVMMQQMTTVMRRTNLMETVRR